MTSNDPSGDTLAELDLAAEPLVACRGGGLSAADRELYRRIIGRFADGHPPTLAQLRQQASRRGIDHDAPLQRLAAADLLCRDADTGELASAYPFSRVPTRHTVQLNGKDVYAMCAVDALGVAYMLTRPITVRSKDPHTGAPITVHIDPATGTIDATPPDTVALAGQATGAGATAALCCPVTNFSTDAPTARAYLASHPDVAGRVVSLHDAAEAGRVLFADLLTG